MWNTTLDIGVFLQWAIIGGVVKRYGRIYKKYNHNKVWYDSIMYTARRTKILRQCAWVMKASPSVVIHYSTQTETVLKWANILHDEITGVMWHFVQKFKIFYDADFFTRVMKIVFVRNFDDLRKSVFYNLNLKIMQMNDNVNLLELIFLIDYEEQHSKYQYTLQICWLDLNLLVILNVFV